MKTKRPTAAIAASALGISAAMFGLTAIAEDVVALPVPAPAVIIDKESLKIDVAAHVRSIDASLRRATVAPAAEDRVKVAAADARARG